MTTTRQIPEGIPVTIWEAHKVHADERRAHSGTIGYYSSREKAQVAISEQYAAEVRPVWALRFQGNIYLLQSDPGNSDPPWPIGLDYNITTETERVRKEALRKLSVAEKRALGLPVN